MLWIYIAIFAYFLDALVFVIDKSLLSKDIPHPSAYAFFVSLLSIFALLLYPFGVHALAWRDFLVALVCGASFFVGLVFLYRTVRKIDVTEAMPAIGGVTALVTFALSLLILTQAPTSSHELLAFLLLVGGTLMMSYFHLSSSTLVDILCSGSFLALSYVTLKVVFNLTDFINGLFWTRIGLLLAAFSILLLPKVRRQVFGALHSASHESKFIFIANKVLAAIAFVLLYYAIKIGDVVFVNAIQGVQYVFILVIGLALYHSVPRLFERDEKLFSVRKLIATVCIIAGVALLFV
ncbi:MAG TPA: hypothetical protein VFK07_00400 [Candidatus Paceibacterota bacterium]|nr:hypothetical protein [Candidatus Paceibacterota bacterium]